MVKEGILPVSLNTFKGKIIISDALPKLVQWRKMIVGLPH